MAFFKRDYYAQRNYLRHYFINYCLIFPMISTFVFGYLQSNLFFDGVTPQKITTLLTGNILLIFFIVPYVNNMGLFFDLISDRFINYQITILSPRLLLLQRALFNAFLTFIILLAYYPMAKLLLGSYFDTSNTCWPAVAVMIFFGSLTSSAYSLFIACFLTRVSQLSHVWPRCNEHMLMLGGFWIPLFVMKQLSPQLAIIARINPLIYITEGLRQAIIGGDRFLPLITCVISLACFFLLFFALATYYFKKRVDHI